MTERAHQDWQNSEEWVAPAEYMRAQDFVDGLYKRLLAAQEARQMDLDSDLTKVAVKRAKQFADTEWKGHYSISLRLPDGLPVYDHNSAALADTMGVFVADVFDGFDNVGARFKNTATSRYVRIPDVGLVGFGASEYNLNPYANYE